VRQSILIPRHCCAAHFRGYAGYLPGTFAVKIITDTRARGTALPMIIASTTNPTAIQRIA
jgi:hypothetical protein